MAPSLSLENWADLLCSHLAAVQSVHIFIDALDECVELEAASILKTLNNIIWKTQINTKWLFTSRAFVQAGKAIPVDRKIALDRDQVDRDIQRYLPEAFQNDPKLSSFSKEARDCIIPEIAAKSAGM